VCSDPKPCPTCGRCPTCGHVPSRPHDWLNPWPYVIPQWSPVVPQWSSPYEVAYTTQTPGENTCDGSPSQSLS
jgi:hypothetical protein